MAHKLLNIKAIPKTPQHVFRSQHQKEIAAVAQAPPDERLDSEKSELKLEFHNRVSGPKDGVARDVCCDYHAAACPRSELNYLEIRLLLVRIWQTDSTVNI